MAIPAPCPDQSISQVAGEVADSGKARSRRCSRPAKCPLLEVLQLRLPVSCRPPKPSPYRSTIKGRLGVLVSFCTFRIATSARIARAQQRASRSAMVSNAIEVSFLGDESVDGYRQHTSATEFVCRPDSQAGSTGSKSCPRNQPILQSYTFCVVLRPTPQQDRY
jgi:hypothetical protein